MKQRYIYALLFGMPGLVISALPALIVGAYSFANFGDSYWPVEAGWAEVVVSAIAFITSLLIITGIGFSVGKRREINNTPVNNKHVALLILMSVLMGVLLVWFAFNFEKDPSYTCHDLCVEKGKNYDGASPSFVLRDSNEGTVCFCENSATGEYEEVGIVGSSHTDQLYCEKDSDCVFQRTPESYCCGNICPEVVNKANQIKVKLSCDDVGCTDHEYVCQKEPRCIDNECQAVTVNEK